MPTPHNRTWWCCHILGDFIKIHQWLTLGLELSLWIRTEEYCRINLQIIFFTAFVLLKSDTPPYNKNPIQCMTEGCEKPRHWGEEGVWTELLCGGAVDGTCYHLRRGCPSKYTPFYLLQKNTYTNVRGRKGKNAHDSCITNSGKIH